MGATASWRMRLTTIAREFEADCADPGAAQARTLARILAQARASSFGAEHHLAEVHTLDEYRAAVPLRSSAELQPYARRAMAGERDVLFPGVPIFIGKTSGTTGESKYVCYPPAAEETVWRQLAPWLARFSDDELACGFFLAGRYREETSPGGVIIGSATGFLRHVIQSVPWFHAVPEELYELADYEARYVGMLRVLLTKPLRALVTPNPSTILTLLQQVKLHRGRLIADLAAPSPEIAARLRGLPEQLTLSDLWPQLAKVATWQDGGTALYREKLQASAPGATLLRAPSGSTEGMILTRGWAPDDGCIPSLQCSFFEYAPATGDPEATRTVADLEAGETVRLVLTSERGMYRCLTDDLYQVVGRHHATPRLRYVGRSTLTSSLTGEKVTELQILAVLEAILAGLTVDVQVAPVWGDPPRYALIVEPADDRMLAIDERPRLLARFEAELRRQNAEYGYKRDTFRLAPPMLVILERGEFARRRRAQSDATSRSDAQLKVPALCKDLFVASEYRIHSTHLEAAP